MKLNPIFLHDKINKTTTKVEDFPAMSKTDLKKRLLELQKAYCKGDEIPVVSERKVQDDGFLINVLIAESDCNFCYLSPIENV